MKHLLGILIALSAACTSTSHLEREYADYAATEVKGYELDIYEFCTIVKGIEDAKCTLMIGK